MSSAVQVKGNRVSRAAVISGCVAVAVVVVGGLVWFLWGRGESVAPEPSSSVQERERAELAACRTTLDRLQVMERRMTSKGSMSQAERHQVIIATLAESVNNSLVDFAHLPPEQKRPRALELQRDAEKTQAYFRRFPKGKQREAVSLLMQSADGKAQFNRAMDIVGNQLTPSDLVLLGPTIRVWASMIKEK